MVDQETCTACEGSGAIWADGKAHYPYYRGETVACTCCGGKGWWAIDNPTAMSDLLAVCEDMTETICHICKRLNPHHAGCQHCQDMDAWKAVIAKAKGES